MKKKNISWFKSKVFDQLINFLLKSWIFGPILALVTNLITYLISQRFLALFESYEFVVLIITSLVFISILQWFLINELSLSLKKYNYRKVLRGSTILALVLLGCIFVLYDQYTFKVEDERFDKQEIVISGFTITKICKELIPDYRVRSQKDIWENCNYDIDFAWEDSGLVVWSFRGLFILFSSILIFSIWVWAVNIRIQQSN